VAANDIYIDLPPRRLWRILADPFTYADWVVGAKRIRDADPHWPELGSRFHHTVGFGPLTLRDHTEVEEVEPSRRLALRAKTRPMGTAHVIFELHEEGHGTRVTIRERPADGLPARLYNGLADMLLKGRNQETLRRLKVLAEGT
jgi:uncharacterized protein YndB with AHSA1/START domain